VVGPGRGDVEVLAIVAKLLGVALEPAALDDGHLAAGPDELARDQHPADARAHHGHVRLL
jgi:hypothetical protein